MNYYYRMDPVQELSRRKIEHENNKAKFDKWIKENQILADTKEYDEYVQNFRAWEQNILEAIEQIQSSITRRPVEQAPQLPTQDLDGQLHTMLDNIPITKFTSALVKLCNQDHSIFNLLTEVDIILALSLCLFRLSIVKRKERATQILFFQ